MIEYVDFVTEHATRNVGPLLGMIAGLLTPLVWVAVRAAASKLRREPSELAKLLLAKAANAEDWYYHPDNILRRKDASLLAAFDGGHIETVLVAVRSLGAFPTETVHALPALNRRDRRRVVRAFQSLRKTVAARNIQANSRRMVEALS